MPELPEVETVRRILEQQLLNIKIIGAEVYYEKILQGISKEEFINVIKNEVFKSFRRFGKYLIIIFEHITIIIHLRMEGKFFIKPKDEPIDKHEHLSFHLENGLTLRYHDIRKFGRFYFIPSIKIEKIKEHPALSKLGFDANQEGHEEELFNRLSKKNVPVKVALLDQTVIAGLGNIYVNEVCFLSKIHPNKKSSSITIEEARRLSYYSKLVLDEAIKWGGTTIRSYTSSLGVTGRFQQYLKVHKRKNLPCFECNTPISKIKVGGRGTYFCPNCQKESNTVVIGITGGIATGKSFVNEVIRSFGYKVLSADVIVHDMLINNQKVIDEIKNMAPEVVIDNLVNRIKLGQLIFNNEESKRTLERIIHPIVKQVLIDEIKQAKDDNLPVIFMEVPLLYETKLDALCDEVIVVITDEIINIKRLMERDNIDERYARIKIKNQMPLEEKIKRATYLIDNSSEKEETIKQIKTILKRKW